VGSGAHTSQIGARRGRSLRVQAAAPNGGYLRDDRDQQSLRGATNVPELERTERRLTG
jgi:hypothetical protein